MEKRKILIGGKWVLGSSSESIDIIDPSYGIKKGELTAGQEVDINSAVSAANKSIVGEWGNLSALERGRLLAKLGRLILEHEEILTGIEVQDVGKPVTQARNDVQACARYCEFYAGAVDKLHGQTIPYQKGYTVMTLREPHGVTAHIIPWNYPLQIIGRSVMGALAAGNAVVIKPGEDASLSTLFLGELFQKAGFPPGSVNIVTGRGAVAGAALASHPNVQHISFTGSADVGSLIQKMAAENKTPVTLELGGKSPQIVFADADLEKALPFLVNAAIQNAGQTCSAGSRILVENSIYDQLVDRLSNRFEKLIVGPADRDLNIGPLISSKQMERVNRFLEKSSDLDLLASGKFCADLPEGGTYLRPMLFGEVPSDHCLAQEEIFGPVLSVIRFDSEQDAINLANSTKLGLVTGVWTKDGARQFRVARAIKSGQVFINNYGAGGGVELPFGGVKGSGYGREKGMEALYGFTTLKTVAFHHD